MGTLLLDLKYAARIHTKRIGLTTIAVLTLALGIGASSAVFVVVNAVLLKPLPYSDSGKIVIPWRQAPPGLNLGYNEIPWGVPSFRLMARDSKTMEYMGAFKSDSFNLTGSGDPAILQGILATSGFFPALGAEPALGRSFTAENDIPGHEHEVILGYRLWQERFGGSPDVLGRPLALNGSVYTVVGVMPSSFEFPHGEEMPASFDFPRRAELWVPLVLPPSVPENAPDELAVIGRLKSGITMSQVQEEMNVLATRMDGVMGSKGWFKSRVTPLVEQVAGDTRKPLVLMLGAVIAVLLIACSNVASLFLARSIERRPEFTLRAAIGAGPSRLARQLFTESVLLAVVAGLLGALIAYIGVYFLKIFGPSNIPRLQEVGLDFRVLAFVLGVTLVSGILFGLAPALRMGRNSIADWLKEGGQRSGGSATGSRARNALMVFEVALALVLAIAAGLLSRTFLHLLNVDPGFSGDRVLAFQLSLPASKYSDLDHIVALYQKVLQALPSQPGVEQVGLVKTLPLSGATEGSIIRVPGRPSASRQDRPASNYNVVSPGYFGAAGTPVLKGRDFFENDTVVSMPVVIINSAMAKKFWPGQDPIGKQVGLGSPAFPLMNIVGVVADIKHLSLREEPGPEMYVPYTQKPYPSILMMSVVLRTKTDPKAVMGGVRKAIHSLDPDLPMTEPSTLAMLRADSMAQPRFSMFLLASFAALALLLACVGMYGVISYSVMQRTREIGVRMALGAQRKTVFGMIIAQGAKLAGMGIVIGILAALGLTHLMASFLYGIQTTDLLTFLIVPLLLAAVAFFACYLPARRATHVDPIVALRYE
jgi:putative ABC transport system permease protein